MTYTPNFSDPRVAKRINTALGFAVGVLSVRESRPWSTRYIDKHFGQHQHPLSKYCRDTLLICTHTHWDMDRGKCKQYRLNALGVAHLKEQQYYHAPRGHVPEQLKTNWQDPLYDNWLVEKLISEQFSEEIAIGEFKYRESHHRLWNNLQNYKRCFRKPYLSKQGYRFSYDIEACAPTIIEQLSRRYHCDLWMPHLEEYLQHKDSVRNSLSNDFELDRKTTKILINSLFCGARIGLSGQFATSVMLDNDVSKILLAKQHPYLTGLRADIKTAWSYIIDSSEEISRRRNADSNRLIPVSSKDKWLVYFKYERYLINAIAGYLKQRDIKFFLEHDGWSCDSEIDQTELVEHIKTQTGFDVKLKRDE